jgi:eukaryotic-like serine/threonine-protein kinase
MGTVYEVEHTELGKRFVLKALSSDLSRREDLVARLRNEQRALGRLEHPSIVNVTDAGVTTSNVPYFVMERLDGETLGARLKRTGCLPIGEALEVAAAVLDGLAAAHEIGVVHRDIKPQNIFLAHGKYPKILDFGVAKIANPDSAITARGVAVGTPRYMSPEQASGEKLDGRSDVYAVGLLLYESVVGKGAFDDARDANEMLLAHLSRQAPRLSSRVGSVTRELDDFLASLLAKSPSARPPTAGAAAAGLRALALPYAQSAREVAGRAMTVRMDRRREPATTHADGVAARQAWSLRESATEDAKTLARAQHSHGRHDTLIDEGGRHDGADAVSSGDDFSTLHDTRAALTTRTEILSVVDAPTAGDGETHTLVPMTPTDGSRTLEPVPLSKLPLPSSTGQGRTRLVAVLGVALAAGVTGGGYAIAHGFSWAPGIASTDGHAAATRPPLTVPKVSTAPTLTLARRVIVPPVAALAAAASTAEPRPSRVSSVSTTAPASSGAAGPAALPQKPAKLRPQARIPAIPDGLPSSGL